MSARASDLTWDDVIVNSKGNRLPLRGSTPSDRSLSVLDLSVKVLVSQFETAWELELDQPFLELILEPGASYFTRTAHMSGHFDPPRVVDEIAVTDRQGIGVLGSSSPPTDCLAPVPIHHLMTNEGSRCKGVFESLSVSYRGTPGIDDSQEAMADLVLWTTEGRCEKNSHTRSRKPVATSHQAQSTARSSNRPRTTPAPAAIR